MSVSFVVLLGERSPKLSVRQVGMKRVGNGVGRVIAIKHSYSVHMTWSFAKSEAVFW